MKADISILFENPQLNTAAVLEIEPLAPLSIVSTLPGSYYKSLDAPTKANLCGLFENVLGWHIGPKDRKAILKKMAQVYKKRYKITKFEKTESSVAYQSLLGHLFEISFQVIPPIDCRYDDLWKQQLKGSDARHIKGTPNLSYYLIKQKRELAKDEKGKISDKTYSDFFAENISEFPMYYTSPTPREFIVPGGLYQLKLSIFDRLKMALTEKLAEHNTTYVGTSEGWVHLALKDI